MFGETSISYVKKLESSNWNVTIYKWRFQVPGPRLILRLPKEITSNSLQSPQKLTAFCRLPIAHVEAQGLPLASNTSFSKHHPLFKMYPKKVPF